MSTERDQDMPWMEEEEVAAEEARLKSQNAEQLNGQSAGTERESTVPTFEESMAESAEDASDRTLGFFNKKSTAKTAAAAKAAAPVKPMADPASIQIARASYDAPSIDQTFGRVIKVTLLAFAAIFLFLLFNGKMSSSGIAILNGYLYIFAGLMLFVTFFDSDLPILAVLGLPLGSRGYVAVCEILDAMITTEKLGLLASVGLHLGLLFIWVILITAVVCMSLDIKTKKGTDLDFPLMIIAFIVEIAVWVLGFFLKAVSVPLIMLVLDVLTIALLVIAAIAFAAQKDKRGAKRLAGFVLAGLGLLLFVWLVLLAVKAKFIPLLILFAVVAIACLFLPSILLKGGSVAVRKQGEHSTALWLPMFLACLLSLGYRLWEESDLFYTLGSLELSSKVFHHAGGPILDALHYVVVELWDKIGAGFLYNNWRFHAAFGLLIAWFVIMEAAKLGTTKIHIGKKKMPTT